MRVRVLGGLLIAAALVFGACGEPASAVAATTVTATLTDQAISLSVPSVSVGKVSFKVVNSGTVVHSLVLIKTDTAHDKLPADPRDASKVTETGSVLATGQVQVGQSKELTRDLAAGNYVVICNEPAHYIVGMHIGFQVKK